MQKGEIGTQKARTLAERRNFKMVRERKKSKTANNQARRESERQERNFTPFLCLAAKSRGGKSADEQSVYIDWARGVCHALESVDAPPIGQIDEN